MLTTEVHSTPTKVLPIVLVNTGPCSKKGWIAGNQHDPNNLKQDKDNLEVKLSLTGALHRRQRIGTLPSQRFHWDCRRRITITPLRIGTLPWQRFHWDCRRGIKHFNQEGLANSCQTDSGSRPAGYKDLRFLQGIPPLDSELMVRLVTAFSPPPHPCLGVVTPRHRWGKSVWAYVLAIRWG